MANRKQPSRRTFLKASGIAAVSTALIDERAGSQAQTTSRTAAPQRSLVDSVNVLQGTASTQEFARGNTLPIAAMPFGMAHWTLQSHDDTPWMFQPGVRRIQGFRCTHQLSPWLSDYGQATFLPFRGEIYPSQRFAQRKADRRQCHRSHRGDQRRYASLYHGEGPRHRLILPLIFVR